MNALGVFFNRPIPYGRGLEIQRTVHAARRAGRIPDTVLLLEHTPVVTLGRRGRTQHLKISEEALRARGMELHTASRGGDVTYHGPGQWVLYPILHLGDHGADAHGYLYNLEETAIRTAADFGIAARRREGQSGAWTDAGKIAAIGFHIKRWITLHGMSLNVCPDMSGFETIVPCGLIGEPVASFRSILGASAPSMHAVRERLAARFEEVFDRPLERFEADDRLPEEWLKRIN